MGVVTFFAGASIIASGGTSAPYLMATLGAGSTIYFGRDDLFEGYN